MTKDRMVDLTNRSLAGEMFRYDDLEDIYDDVIDDVNSKLNTCFPVLSDWEDFVEDYNAKIEGTGLTPLDPQNYTAIPDTWLRKLMRYGAAYKFYIMDEEGERVASEYYVGYQETLFTMLRDYAEHVPDIFRRDCDGYVFDTGGAFI